MKHRQLSPPVDRILIGESKADPSAVQFALKETVHRAKNSASPQVAEHERLRQTVMSGAAHNTDLQAIIEKQRSTILTSNDMLDHRQKRIDGLNDGATPYTWSYFGPFRVLHDGRTSRYRRAETLSYLSNADKTIASFFSPLPGAAGHFLPLSTISFWPELVSIRSTSEAVHLFRWNRSAH